MTKESKNTNQKEIKLSVEKEETKQKIDTDAIEKLEKTIEELKASLKNKVYKVTSDETIGNALLSFIKNEAKWKNTESLGIIEISKQIEKFTSSKEKKLMMDSTGVQALYYFIGNFEGKGLDSAISYVNTLLKPVSDTIRRIEKDKNELEHLEFQKASLEQGITPENAEETLKQ
jgi:hypothetical protein